MGVSRNPNFYTVGIPNLYFYRILDWEDPKRVDWLALYRAYAGLVDEGSGEVLNLLENSTCMKPNDILERAYIGNLASCEVGGDIKTVEHVASILGRKEVDKQVLIRRSLEYTIGFDEMKDSLKKFFIDKDIEHPTKTIILAKTTRINQGNFAEDELEIVSSDFDDIGEAGATLEDLLTLFLQKQGAELGAWNNGTDDVYPSGIYYFLVPDRERREKVSVKLENYRGRIICGYFKYDASAGKMKLQDFPSGLDTSAYMYKDTSLEERIKMFITEENSGNGFKPNSIFKDKTNNYVAVESVEWNVDTTDNNTLHKLIQLPKHLNRQSIRVKIKGQVWDSGNNVWQDATDNCADITQADASTDTTSILLDLNGNQLVENSYVNYDQGRIYLELKGGLVTDMNNQSRQTMRIEVEIHYSSAENTLIIWSGLSWAKNSETFTVSKVNRSLKEIEGCALIIFKNNVGVSYAHLIPKAVLRPDGTIDFTKEDWAKGNFIISVVRDDEAYIPYTPVKVYIPFGYINTFRIRELD